MKLAMASIMLTVKFKSMQHPGAVVNCTLKEYNSSTIVDGVKVIRVKEHTTGKHGSAKLTTDGVLSTRLEEYFRFIRPKLAEPGKDINRLFILPGSKQIYKIGLL